MNIYPSQTGKTTTGLLSQNRNVGMVAIGTVDPALLDAETLKIYTEGNKVPSKEIAMTKKLLAMCALSVHGMGGGHTDGTHTIFNIPIATGGALSMAQGEELYVEGSIVAARTYFIDTVDGGSATGTPLKYVSRNLLSEKDSDVVDVLPFQKMAITGASHITEVNVTLKSNEQRRYSYRDLLALEAEQQDFAYVLPDGTMVARFPQDIICLDVHDYSKIEFFTDGTKVELLFIEL